jgi:hypothetical protein
MEQKLSQKGVSITPGSVSVFSSHSGEPVNLSSAINPYTDEPEKIKQTLERMVEVLTKML